MNFLNRLILIFLLAGNILFALPETKLKGNIGECVYNSLYPTVGKIVGEYNLVNGIDHIDVIRDKFGKITKCTITDSKFGNAKLGLVLNPKTGKKDIMQMSDEWILANLETLNTMDLTKSKLDQQTKNKILKFRNSGEYRRLSRLVKSGVCKKKLFNLKLHPDGSINMGYSDVLNNGNGQVKTVLDKTNKHANRYVGLSNGKKDLDKLSTKDKRLVEKVYECTAKTLCSKGDRACIAKKKVSLYKNPSLLQETIHSASDEGMKKKQQRLANTNRRASASVMKEKPKSSKSNVMKKPTTVKPKLSKLSSSAAKSAAKRGIAKGMAAGIGQYIPYVGVVAQVAWDAYLGYKIEMHDEQIANNEQNIQLNRKYIENVEKRVQQEQEILNTKISANSVNIMFNMQKIIENSEQLAALDEGLSTVIWQVSNVQILAEQNKQDIQAFKDGIFKTGVQKLNEYYETNDSDYLDEAITELDKTKNIENPTVEALADYYLVIARYENYLTEHHSHEFDEIKRNYDELAKIVLEDPANIGLLNSAYMSISDLESHKLEFFKDILQTVTDESVSSKIKNAKFDEALDIAKNYIAVVSKNDTNTIYQKALKAKQDNFNRLKNFTSVSNALKVVEENQNSLLNEEAIRFLAKEKSMQNALELLRTKRLGSESLRLKGFVCIYNYLNDKEMVKKIQKMVKENPVYPEAIQNEVLSLHCKKENR